MVPCCLDTPPIRVLIADDHPMLREGVGAVIALQSDMKIVAEAEDGEEAVAAYAQYRPDVVLMDLRMPGTPGLHAIRGIRELDAEARIIVLTTYSGDLQVRQALRAGAAAYLIKSSLRRELLSAIRAVYRGESAQPAGHPALPDPAASGQALSPRETEVLTLVAQGHSNKQIGWRLGLSEETVKSNIKNILRKLDVRDRTHAVARAATFGLIDL